MESQLSVMHHKGLELLFAYKRWPSKWTVWFWQKLHSASADIQFSVAGEAALFSTKDNQIKHN